MPRILNRNDMRNDDNDPHDPGPEDYILTIKAWLEDERTKAPFPLEVDYMGDQFLCLRVYIPLPPVYQGPWSTGSLAGEQREADRQPPGQEAGNAAGSEEPERLITLRIWIDWRLSLDVDFELPHKQFYASELEPSETEPHKLYVYEELELDEEGTLLEEVDIFEEDSATQLKSRLSWVGIDLYCPVQSIGDALLDKK